MPGTGPIEVSPFVIRELSGDKREVRLTGRALPYRPFHLVGTQRVDATWLPGSSEATLTILGAAEEPTQINGKWKQKYLSQGDRPFQLDNEQVATVQSAIELMNSVRLRGQLVEVTWMAETRRGIITRFEYDWETAYDVGWMIEFTWMNRGEDTFASVFTTATGVNDAASQMKILGDQVNDIALPKGGINFGITESILGLQQRIEGLIFSVEDTVMQFTNQVLGPVQAMRGLIATLRSVEEETALMIEFVNSRTAHEFRPLTPRTGNETYIAEFASSQEAFQKGTGGGYAEKLGYEQYRAELRAWARALRAAALALRLQYNAQVASDILARHTARFGEDLRDVARRYYGSPFEWRRILTFNGLSTSELQAGQLLKVPRLNPEDASGVGG